MSDNPYIEEKEKPPKLFFEGSKTFKIKWGKLCINLIKLNTSKIKFSNIHNKIHHNQVEFILGIQE